MVSCELLNAARIAAAKKGLSKTAVSCPYLNTSACEGVGIQAPGERVAPACYIIPEAVTAIPSSPRRVELFQQRALVTQMGRRPLSATF